MAVLVLVGCSLVPGGNEGGEGPAKNVDERGLRTDEEPLTRRFPGLGGPVSARWQSGTLGDDRLVPGPSTFWIDAVVELEPRVADRLRSAASPTGVGQPELTPDVAGEAPDGQPEAVAGLGHGSGVADGWTVEAWLVEGTDTVLLSAIGE